MLEDERERYVNSLAEKHPGFFPDILSNETLFLRECRKNNKKRAIVVKRKNQDGEGLKEGEEPKKDGDDDVEDELGFASEDDEDDDDVGVFGEV